MEQEKDKTGLGQYLKNAVQQGLQVLKNPVKLLPTIAISAVWIIIGILSSLWKPFPWPMQVLSFLSYAEGGLFGGVLGAVGGIAGKVVMAVFINSLILPLFEKKPPFVGVAGGLKGMFSNMSKDTAKGIAPLLMGVGIALFLYTFMNINQRWQNSMVGLMSAVMLLQNIGNKGGFLTGLIFSGARTITKGKVPRHITVVRFLTGMTLGMTLAVGLSLVGLHWCFWLAYPFFITGVILAVVAKNMQQQPASAKAAVGAVPPPPPGAVPVSPVSGAVPPPPPGAVPPPPPVTSCPPPPPPLNR